jgi:hypothetical protein
MLIYDLTRSLAMIHSLSSTAQFITTTFRPEMLVNSDQFYGVLFNNQKISSIRGIKREEAMEFVDQVCLHCLLSVFSADVFATCRRRSRSKCERYILSTSIILAFDILFDRSSCICIVCYLYLSCIAYPTPAMVILNQFLANCGNMC